jgi:uncharacterized membrane protein
MYAYRRFHRRRIPLWAVPMVYVVVSTAAAMILPRLEHAYLHIHLAHLSADSARDVFATIASGMLAFTGIVFAIAFLVVQFGSAAYSPRLAVLFVEKSSVYHILGIFFATFTYSLAALTWTDRGGDGGAPLLSSMVVGGLLLISLLGFSVLIRSVDSLQIHKVLQTIGRQGRSLIAEMPYADAKDQRDDEADVAAPPGVPLQKLIYSGEPQVVAELDFRTLLDLALSADALIWVECSICDALMEDAPMVSVYGASKPLPEAALRRAFSLEPLGTYEQDPRFAIRLLVDVAIRALSPAVNDPTTAVQAVDQIEDLMRRLGRRQLDSGSISDAAGTVRIIFPTPSWEDYLALSFDEIRHYGAGSLQVQRRLRAALAGLAEALPEGERRAAVSRYIIHMDESMTRSTFDAYDRESGLVADPQGLGSPRRRRTAAPSLPH